MLYPDHLSPKNVQTRTKGLYFTALQFYQYFLSIVVNVGSGTVVSVCAHMQKAYFSLIKQQAPKKYKVNSSVVLVDDDDKWRIDVCK